MPRDRCEQINRCFTINVNDKVPSDVLQMRRNCNSAVIPSSWIAIDETGLLLRAVSVARSQRLYYVVVVGLRARSHDISASGVVAACVA
jgi:hypothetical protein